MSDQLPLSFFVSGLPAPGGSKVAGVSWDRATNQPRKTANGRIMTFTKDMGGDRTKNWRGNVAYTAAQHRQGDLLAEALEVDFTFYMPRPAKHFIGGDRTRGRRADAPIFHTGTPDVLKLMRSTEDALTGVIWQDDKRTVKIRGIKLFETAEHAPGCQIDIRRAVDSEVAAVAPTAAAQAQASLFASAAASAASRFKRW